MKDLGYYPKKKKLTLIMEERRERRSLSSIFMASSELNLKRTIVSNIKDIKTFDFKGRQCNPPSQQATVESANSPVLCIFGK